MLSSYTKWERAYISTLVFVAFFSMTMLVSSCASYSVPVDTTRKQILVATAEVRGANFVLQDLVSRQAISRSDAQNARDALQDAKDGLQLALSAVDIAGDPQKAERQLGSAQDAIRAVLLILGPLMENSA